MTEVKLSKEEIKEAKHHTRRLSIKEGIFWSARNSFGDQYVSPFAIAMGTSNSLVAILNSVLNIGPISQLIGSNLVGKHKRKSIFVKTLIAESLGWFLMAAIGILYFKNMFTEFLPFLIILDMGIIVFAGGLGHPAWFSWMGDVIDEKYRGRWWSKRSTIISFATIVLAIMSSAVLKYFKSTNYEIQGFILFFMIAFIARASCINIVKRQYEPKEKKKRKDEVKEYTLLNFVKEIKSSNFGKFVLFRGVFAIAIGLTSSLVSIYLLRTLGFDYLTYMVITMSGTLFSVLTLNLWGKIADKYGNYKVIALTTLIIPLTPLLWILSSSKIYLFLVPAILGGTSWTAFSMASGNFIYDNVSKEKRSKAISYFNLFVGIGAVIGGLLASYLIEAIHTTRIKPIYLIFIIGTILRMLIISLFIPSLNEVKKRSKLKGFKELENILFKEAKPTILEDLHEITSIKNYLKEK